MENAAHNVCRFFVHQPVVLFLWVLLEPVGDRVGDGLAGPSTHLILRFLFPATVPDVPLIEYVAQGSEVVLALCAVHSVIDSDEADTVLWEYHVTDMDKTTKPMRSC